MDPDFWCEAIWDALDLLHMNESKAEYAFDRLWLWAENYHQVWAESGLPFVASLYSTLVTTTGGCGMLVGDGANQYIALDWRKIDARTLRRRGQNAR